MTHRDAPASKPTVEFSLFELFLSLSLFSASLDIYYCVGRERGNEKWFFTRDEADIGGACKKTSALRSNRMSVRYRVFIKYCVFSKILRYIPYSGLSRFPPGVSVCTPARQLEHQRCTRTCRVQKYHNILRKKKYLMQELLKVNFWDIFTYKLGFYVMSLIL